MSDKVFARFSIKASGPPAPDRFARALRSCPCPGIWSQHGPHQQKRLYCWERYGREEQCIRKLVELDVFAVGLRDDRTGLYPFQIAATMEEHIFDMLAFDNNYYRPDEVRDDDWSRNYHGNMKKEMQNEAGDACLNTIFYLLRKDPSKAMVCAAPREKKATGPLASAASFC